MLKEMVMLLLFVPVLLSTLHAAEGPAISNVTINRTKIPRYEKFEITFDAAGTWKNPFDPDEVAVDAIVKTPDGKTVTMPAFYFQDYHRSFVNGRQKLTLVGKPVWKARLCPLTVGKHTFKLRLVSAGKTVETEEQAFECTDNGNKHGFLRVARENPYYFRFDDDTPFFAIGMNVASAWSSRGTADLDKWYTDLARAGGNFVRAWWCSGCTDIESRVTAQRLGKYKLDCAWCIDHLVELSERLGIHVMCCLETQQYLRREKSWPHFTYNVANGGPVKSPADYFVNPEADKYFRKRLRYIVARWSYSTSIFSWQFWNEVSACNDYNDANAAKWHERMARYLRSVDPYDHIIHTNYGNMDGFKAVDGLPEMEVVSTNIYSRRDMGRTSSWGSRWMTGRYKKPYLMTEYGVGHHGGWIEEDPKGVIVHNGLWGAAFSGSAGTGLPWGWSHWIDPQNMYHYWRVVADVVRDVPFHKRQWKPVTVEKLVFKDGGKPYYAGAFVEGWPRNYSYRLAPTPRPTQFRILPDGTVDKPVSFNAVFYGGASQTLSVDFPVNGKFVVHVPEIGSKGEPVLRVVVDGKEALRQKLPHDTKEGWSYWKSYPLDIPAGHHEIEIANAAGGGLWTAYELQNFVRREGPDLQVIGMQTDDIILLWVRNPQFIWIYEREGRALKEQKAGGLTLSGVSDGRYAGVWRETTTGEVLARRVASAEGGRLTMVTPPITRSAAVKLVKQTP